MKDQKLVILIHGLFMEKFSMKYFEYHLKKLGYKVENFQYSTYWFSAEKTFKRIDKIIQKYPNYSIYLVGHSMGGLVARGYIQNHLNHYPIDKIVTIGTPHQGSSIAKYLYNTRFKFILGRSGNSGLVKELPSWNEECPIGCIAGISNIGIHFIFKKLHKKTGLNDGNVFVEEALLPNATDNITIRGSHSRLIFSKKVIEKCHQFLQNNHF